jgi:hypothetical protein
MYRPQEGINRKKNRPTERERKIDNDDVVLFPKYLCISNILRTTGKIEKKSKKSLATFIIWTISTTNRKARYCSFPLRALM